jgi:hypothetical protein
MKLKKSGTFNKKIYLKGITTALGRLFLPLTSYPFQDLIDISIRVSFRINNPPPQEMMYVLGAKLALLVLF